MKAICEGKESTTINPPFNLTSIEEFLDLYFCQYPPIKPFSKKELKDFGAVSNAPFLVFGISRKEVEEITDILFDFTEPFNKTALPFGLFCYLFNIFFCARTGYRLRARHIKRILVDESISFLDFKLLRGSFDLPIIRCPFLKEHFFEDGRPNLFDVRMKHRTPYPLYNNLPPFLQEEILQFKRKKSQFLPAWRERFMKTPHLSFV